MRLGVGRHDIPVPLTIIDCPTGITGSVLAYIAELHRENPRDLIVVYIPEYVVGQLVGARAAQPVGAAPQGPACCSSAA